MQSQVRIVLASASDARLRTLRGAGLDPEVMVSGVDEDSEAVDGVRELTARLAQLKAQAVSAGIDHGSGITVVIGCDSMLELDGMGYGKPGTPAEAARRWQRMRGRSGLLHTGHHVMLHQGGAITTRTAVASTLVHFAELTDEEIEAYVISAEPLQVAGGFTVDGLGGPFITGVEGDHHNVVGLSLPLLRTILNELGISWPSLWRV
ncbi:MAG TPA: Maf family protein [Propionibacteriaceae bacterium]|jgi:septum formation protein|nr:Maf family protein [Propionibacteriaceae bacterium]